MAFNRDKALAAAAKFAAKGQHDRAAKEYASVVEADPSDIRSWLLLADALKLMGDTAGAIERFLHVGKHYTDAGEHQKALAVYRQVLQIDAARLDVQGKVAGLYKDLGRTQDAIAAYEFVAQAHFQAGQIAEGLEGFRMVAELDPGAVGKRLRLAELYSREGMVPQAVEHFRLAADKLFNDRRLDDYIRVAERLIYHKEDDLPVLRSLARIYLSQNENRRALVKLNALLRSAPADPEGLELLADTFVALGKQDKAVSVLQELAREQRKGGRKAKVLAARVLKKAIALGPENAEDLKKIAADIDAEIAALPADPKEQTEDVDLDVDVVEEEAPGGGDLDLDVEVEDVPSRPFAGVGANLAPSAAEQPEDNVGDTDKLLLEVRVYVKYKMHEHALGHLDSIFVRDPNNVTALELQASIFETLDRGAEAADTYVRLAQLTAARDAKLAREQIERALKLAPNHTKAEMVLAALDSGNGVASDQVAPLVRGLKDPARFDGGADTSGTRPIAVAEPTDASPQQPEAANDVAPKTGPNEQAAAAETSAAKAAPTETSAAKPVEPVAAETSAAKAEPTETSAAKAVEPVATETSAAKAVPTETSAAKVVPTETSTAKAVEPVATETSAAKAVPTETSAAKAIEPTATETSAAKAAPTETNAAKAAPTETSAAKAIEPTATETSVAKAAPTETSAAKAIEPTATETSAAKAAPTETSVAKAAPTETSVAKAVEAVREDSGLKTLSPRDDGERIESAAGKTPLPGPLPTRVTEKTPLPRLPSEKTPLPVFKPPAEGKAPAFRPPTPSREPQEEVVEELDEVEEFEAVEVEPEPVRPAPPKKTPPKPAAAPPQRPGKPPPPKSAPPPKKPNTKPAPVSEDSAAKAAPSEVSEAKPVSEDSTAKAAPSEVSEAKPVSEDSTAKAAPSEVSEEKPISEDSTAKAAPSEVSEAKPVSEDSTAKAAPSEVSEAKPVSEDSTAKAAPSEPAPEPVSEDSTKPAEPAEAKPAPEAVEEPSEPVSKDSAPAATPEAAPEAVPQDSTKPAEPEPPSEAKAEPVATTQPDVTETARPAEASAPEAVPEDSAAKTLEAAPAQPEPEAAAEPAAAAQPEPAPTDSSTEPAAEPVAASEPASEKIEWPVIDDEVEELRFFIASRFEDDAQFTYLELQRRFPGHPALAEFADRFSTGAKLESAAAPVVVVDDAPATPAPSEVAPAAPQFEDEDEDFFSSIFDEPAAAPAPSRKTGPQRAVATLDEQADAQTLFDLGMAYHEMGLIDDALTQFGLAAGDRRWTSRANVMIADLRILRGEPDAAIGALEEAIAAASDDDERDAARYRLAEIFATVGNLAAAASTLRLITPGYRERDVLLAQYDETA